MTPSRRKCKIQTAMERKTIARDGQIIKFQFYGFFKNLIFFEPFLLVFLLSKGLDLIAIGFLVSIRELTVYILEVPTGLYADHFGKKRALMICFLSYMFSFLLFFAGSSFAVFAAAMFFFGAGEAFRSGTHKAMIYTYLERMGWFELKTLVYGRTRAYSLIGTAVSSAGAALFAFSGADLRYIFFLTIIPYIIDLFLVASYPAYLDEKTDEIGNAGDFFRSSLHVFGDMFRSPATRKLLADSSVFDAVFKSLKDYVQPAILLLFAVSPLHGSKFTAPGVILALSYTLFAVAGSFAAFHAHLLTGKFGREKTAALLMFAAGAAMVSVFPASAAGKAWPLIACYLILHITHNARRPVLVDMFGDIAKKNARATLLSVDSQLRALLTAAAAPAIGFIAENVSIPSAFMVPGLILMVFSMLSLNKKKEFS